MTSVTPGDSCPGATKYGYAQDRAAANSVGETSIASAQSGLPHSHTRAKGFLFPPTSRVDSRSLSCRFSACSTATRPCSPTMRSPVSCISTLSANLPYARDQGAGLTSLQPVVDRNLVCHRRPRETVGSRPTPARRDEAYASPTAASTQPSDGAVRLNWFAGQACPNARLFASGAGPSSQGVASCFFLGQNQRCRDSTG